MSIMILTQFSPLYIKCKKPLFNEKKLWKCIFEASGRIVFHILPRLHFIWVVSQEFLWIMLQSSVHALCKN